MLKKPIKKPKCYDRQHVYGRIDSEGVKYQHTHDIWLGGCDETNPKRQNPKIIGWFKEYVLPPALQLSPTPMILDLGCRTGYYCPIIEGLGCQFVGLDCIEKFTKWGNEQGRNIVLGDATYCHEYFPENHFDGVLFSNTIEHISDPALCLDNLRKVVKVGAVCLIVAPREGKVGGLNLTSKNNRSKHRIGFPDMRAWKAVIPRSIWVCLAHDTTPTGWKVVLRAA